ncbi:phosphate ABC transporter permease subunit PstC [Prosthecochloris sp. N3]|uniref:Phosphate ABC transporter permease subunit PstC n=1 Tax=Prosthecochloris ethylica TaxID=2743976 RepID=A0ABR9XPA6_9CHLB|nr:MULTISPECIES: PstC family ABC transporter permease [Prosthecochloris]MBF0586159.1 phosphate ABC transporter permease subunit PstC [Prosthecochloris ethylica]MBF0635865.1 phosphate ABC transporter permease subunit PstC [Prosthecochloris ethylica]NUK47460.1 phosphate ABC transporter permease subunit PstC [Prosthecochloris ethylica]RNA65008.1 phosphate ABC transporter permease subunit PstC [Prosthecochloris sp. ZM_2]
MSQTNLGENRMSGAFVVSARKRTIQKGMKFAGEGLLFAIASFVAVVVLFIFFFVARDAIPFFQLRGFAEFFTSTSWYPADAPGEFGALAIIYGSAMVTVGSALIAVPLGVAAAICLSDVLPFSVRQYAKPVIEMLAAIPSVAYGFFALVIFAPLLQNFGGPIMMWAWWLIAGPFMILAVIVLADLLTSKDGEQQSGTNVKRVVLSILFSIIALGFLYWVGMSLNAIQVMTGTNALNVSIILSFMALPTIVSVSEDSLQAVGRELREGSYALGATRAETIVKTVLPAASSGILAAVILGIMRALGETMVVWMASGNSSHIPDPWYNYLDSIRTLTATIAGDMGEADQVTGSARYHVLFAMGLLLLIFSFISNLVSERIVVRQRKILSGQ